jgi:glycosyltransferase involved in cell wall biosynthesis
MRVSVVIPCHNSLRFLPDTLASVLDQELPAGLVDDYDVVLVDDGGTDDLAGWAASLDDPRVQVVRQENAGVSAARNLGVRTARGELVAFCDSDDLWESITVRRLVESFRGDPRIGLTYSAYDVIDADGRPTGRVMRCPWDGEIWDRLVTHNPIGASAVMVRREVFDDVGLFSENRDRFPIDVEDWELWIRIAARWKVGAAPEVLMHHRRHGSNSSMNVESIDAAYRNLLDVVFADAPPERQRLRPIATANIEVRLASAWLHEREEPHRALQHLSAAAGLAPEVRRTPEYLRLRATATVLDTVGGRGHAVLRSVSRGGRRLSNRLRSAASRD